MKRPVSVEHSGPFRAVCGAFAARQGRGAVVCMTCGACQLMPGSWSPGLASQPLGFSDGFRLDLLSAASSSPDEVWRAVRAHERAGAVRDHDAVRLLARCEIPPWWETRRDERGDIWYKEANA